VNEEQILAYMKGRLNKEYYDKFVYMFENGKRIRPELIHSVCNHINRDFHPLFAAAAAIEVMHCLSLVHDDVVDGGNVRRGKPSFNKKFGINAAVLFGDLFATLAFQIFAEEYPKKLHLEFIKTFKIMIEGQIMELEGEVIDIDSYFEYVNKKTTSLFVLCAKIPLIYYGLNEPKVEQFMEEYGIAFQMANDLKDGNKEIGVLDFLAAEEVRELLRKKLKALESLDLPELDPLLKPVKEALNN
jgi:octaprenyl-diphosphate synthase